MSKAEEMRKQRCSGNFGETGKARGQREGERFGASGEMLEHRTTHNSDKAGDAQEHLAADNSNKTGERRERLASEMREAPSLPELLCPAGSTEAMVAAVQNGADAVYLGTGDFNSRRADGNFGESGDAQVHRTADNPDKAGDAQEHLAADNSNKTGERRERLASEMREASSLPELLCPAGSTEAMVAAVQNGADAVYLGAGDFNARRTADNFEGALDSAVRYCQVRGVRVYVTLNTMVRQDELPRLEATIEQVCAAGADGVIVSDLGTARVIRQMAPTLPLHASTQMAAHNPQAVEFLAEQGFRRVVLAREMSFEEIARCAHRGAELEVFVHGALCVSCSGQCLMSSMIGGRSGNRGLCAQPCRQRYALVGREDDLLSTRGLRGPDGRESDSLSTRDLREPDGRDGDSLSIRDRDHRRLERREGDSLSTSDLRRRDERKGDSLSTRDLCGPDRREGYLLSTRDLCGLDNLRALAEAGVASLKIEGRLKRPEYVAQTAAIYRAALDALGRGEDFDAENARLELAQLFNRGGFTRGYGPGLAEPELMYRARPNHLGVEIGRCRRDGEIELNAPIDERDALVLRRVKGEMPGRRGEMDGAMAEGRGMRDGARAKNSAPSQLESQSGGTLGLEANAQTEVESAKATLRDSVAEGRCGRNGFQAEKAARAKAAPLSSDSSIAGAFSRIEDESTRAASRDGGAEGNGEKNNFHEEKASRANAAQQAGSASRAKAISRAEVESSQDTLPGCTAEECGRENGEQAEIAARGESALRTNAASRETDSLLLHSRAMDARQKGLDARADIPLRASPAAQTRGGSSPESAAPAAPFEDIPVRLPASPNGSASLPAAKHGAHAGASLRESVTAQARNDSSPDAAAPAAPFEDTPVRLSSSSDGSVSFPAAKRVARTGASLRESLAAQARGDSSPEGAAPAAHFEDIPVRLPSSSDGSASFPAAKRGDSLVRLTSEEQLQALWASYQGEIRKFPADAKLALRVGEAARLVLGDGAREVCVEGEIVQAARSRPADPERIRAQIAKLGDTPFELRGWSAEIDENAFLPVSALNELRRRAADALLEARRNPPHRCGKLTLPELPMQPRVRPEVIAQSGDPEILRRAIDAGADFACFAPEDLRTNALNAALAALPERFDLALPPVMGEATLNALHAWANSNAACVRRTLLSNVGQLGLDWPGEIVADYPLNVANELAVAQLGEWGVRSYVPSIELNRAQIEALGGAQELVVYGRIPLMQLRHCPLRAAMDARGLHRDCRRCDGCTPAEHIGAKALTDRLGARFPLRRIASDEGCVVQLLNSATLMLLRRRGNLPAAQSWRLLLGADDPIEAVVRLHKIALDGGDPRSDADWAELDGMNTTTGHYFRGVE